MQAPQSSCRPCLLSTHSACHTPKPTRYPLDCVAVGLGVGFEEGYCWTQTGVDNIPADVQHFMEIPSAGEPFTAQHHSLAESLGADGGMQDFVSRGLVSKIGGLSLCHDPSPHHVSCDISHHTNTSNHTETHIFYFPTGNPPTSPTGAGAGGDFINDFGNLNF